MISVIVPIYNAEKYLFQCLESIANQTYNDLEVIFVNDGSTDNSKEICLDFCDKYKNFRLISKENGGQMESWIEGVKICRGDFIGFVDSDDVLDYHFFEKMLKTQQKFDADLVMCHRKIIDINNNVKGVNLGYDLKEYYSKKEMDYIRGLFLPRFEGNLSQARWDKLFKRDLYIECMNKYCKNTVRTFEDRFIVIPYVFYSESFAFVNEPLYLWRQTPMSSSRKPRNELVEISEMLYSSHLSLISDLNVFDKYISRIELEKMDVLRNIFMRNVCIKNSSFKNMVHNAKDILNDKNIEIVVKHKSDCVGKFGKFFYIVFKIKSPFLMALGAKIFMSAKQYKE